jgi:hypothetical protein
VVSAKNGWRAERLNERIGLKPTTEIQETSVNTSRFLVSDFYRVVTIQNEAVAISRLGLRPVPKFQVSSPKMI